MSGTQHGTGKGSSRASTFSSEKQTATVIQAKVGPPLLEERQRVMAECERERRERGAWELRAPKEVARTERRRERAEQEAKQATREADVTVRTTARMAQGISGA